MLTTKIIIEWGIFMKRFDWAVLLLMAAVAVATVWIQEIVEPLICLAAFVGLFLILFLVAIVRRTKLRKMKRKAVELEKRIETERTALLSDISHSLRMPVSIIQGYAELLKQGNVDKRTATEYLDKILEHTYRLTSMLSSKLDNKSAAMSCVLGEKQVVDLLSLVQQQIEDLRASAVTCGVSMQVVAMDGPILVNLDVQQIQRVFFNLVENSVNHMGKEGMVTILLTQKENFVSVTFRDDGLGMREEEVPYIFTDNFRGSNGKHGGGAGHGLFLVKEIIHAHGGEISASSKPGYGFSVQFTLPLAKQ